MANLHPFENGLLFFHELDLQECQTLLEGATASSSC